MQQPLALLTNKKRCQIKFPNIHVRLLEMFTKSSRMQFEDRKLSETVGNCRYGRNKYKETRNH